MTLTIGCDPGITGAIAAVVDGVRLVGLWDMPTTSQNKGAKVSRSVDGAGVAQIISEIKRDFGDHHIAAVVEQTSAMPGQGVSSTYSMGHSRGVVEGALLAKLVPTSLIRPSVWKKSMGLTSDKELVRGEMLRMFPGALITRKKDHDRAEAIALAVYLYKRDYK